MAEGTEPGGDSPGVCGFGDDAFLVREAITAVGRVVFPEKDTDAGISRFAGATTPLATVLDEVRTLPFFSRIRLVVVEDADPFVAPDTGRT